MNSFTSFLFISLVLPAIILGKPAKNLLGLVDSRWQPGSSPNPDSYTVQSGETIEITCASAEKGGIGWDFPSKYTPVEELSEHGQVEITETEDLKSSLYYSTIRVANASYRDTGRYRCYCLGLTNYHHALKHSGNQLIKKISLYVYVADEENLFLTESEGYMQTMMATVGRSVTFPCSVTDPSVELNFYKIKGYDKEVRLHGNDGGRVTMNPETGVTLAHVTYLDTGVYLCRAINGNIEQEKRILIYAVPGAPRIIDPTLIMDHPNSGSVSLTEGDPVSLKCQAPVGRDQITTITWWKTDGHYNLQQISPEENRLVIEDPVLEDLCSGQRNMCSFKRRYGLFLTSDNYQKVSSKLKILTSTVKDLGTYYCNVHSPGKETMSNAVGVHISPEVESNHDIISYEPLPASANGAVGPIIVVRTD